MHMSCQSSSCMQQASVARLEYYKARGGLDWSTGLQQAAKLTGGGTMRRRYGWGHGAGRGMGGRMGVKVSWLGVYRRYMPVMHPPPPPHALWAVMPWGVLDRTVGKVSVVPRNLEWCSQRGR